MFSMYIFVICKASLFLNIGEKCFKYVFIKTCFTYLFYTCVQHMYVQFAKHIKNTR